MLFRGITGNRHRVSYERVYEKIHGLGVNLFPIECVVRMRQLRYLAHVLRMPHDSVVRQVLFSEVEREDLSVPMLKSQYSHKQAFLEAIKDFGYSEREFEKTAKDVLCKKMFAVLLRERLVRVAFPNWKKRRAEATAARRVAEAIRTSVESGDATLAVMLAEARDSETVAIEGAERKRGQEPCGSLSHCPTENRNPRWCLRETRKLPY